MLSIPAVFKVHMNKTLLPAIACLAFSAPLSAGVIVFKNGDRITGDIKSIYDGDVLVEPEYADEFSVDQDKISHIESKKRFDLKLETKFDYESEPAEGADNEDVKILIGFGVEFEK